MRPLACAAAMVVLASACGRSRPAKDLATIEAELAALRTEAEAADQALLQALASLDAVQATQAPCPHRMTEILHMDHGMDTLERRTQDILIQSSRPDGAYLDDAGFLAESIRGALRERLPSERPDPVLVRAQAAKQEINPFRVYASVERGKPIRLVGDDGFVPGTAAGAMYLFDRRSSRVVCVGSFTSQSASSVTAPRGQELGAIHLDAKVRGVLAGLPALRATSP